MDVRQFSYLIPVIAALICFIKYIEQQARAYRFEGFYQRTKNTAISIIQKITQILLPLGSKRCVFYARLLQYSNIMVHTLMFIKLCILMGAFVIIIMIKLTNIAIYTDEILHQFEYQVDLIYRYQDTSIDKNKAMQQEREIFEAVQKQVSLQMLRSEHSQNIQFYMRNIIKQKNQEWILPKEVLANKIYYRLMHYYQIRHMNIPAYLLFALILSFVPELCLAIKNIYAKSEAKKELRFLKRLIILNGSIKPVDFMEVLNILITHAKFYKDILEEVLDKNNRNSVDNNRLYMDYIKQSKDLNLKLFFEKLDQANNYDFEQAVLNIENEFRMQKREEIRSIRKRIEFIHVMGIIGFMGIIALLILYLILPWMQMYDMQYMI